MDSGNDIRSGLVNGAVDHESSGVDSVQVPSLNDVAFFIDKHEIGDAHVLEGLEQGVDPEMVGQDGIPDRNMACAAFVAVSLLPQPSEGLITG